MYEYMIRNGVYFTLQKLKLIQGNVPKSILGSLVRNGPGLITMEDQVIPHWFMSNGSLLKV